ncbi:MAG: T9SS type A sorting domain-containing protein [Bacteroidota bacterium]|nr:T9SS type A sorting domain-containing protein [Bacteroidota bacterium]MDP4288473.1 T9SS type A sorting domain-containing protein [Bacteroidota bacterium]
MSLLLAAATQNASAFVSYSYGGSHQYTWSTNGSTALALTRTGGTTALTVFATLSGSSNFTLDQSSIYWADSSQDTGIVRNTRYLGVYFSSALDDTSTAVLILHDSHRIDTIYLTGYGPHVTDTVDYLLNWNYGLPHITVRRDSGGTSSSGTVYVLNHRTSTITVSISLLDSTNWDINGGGGLLATMAAGGSRTLTITYHPHGVWRDTATVNIVCYTPYYQDTVIHIYVTDPLFAPPSYIPGITAPALGQVQQGDTTCGPVTLTNATSKAIQITAINISADYDWSLSSVPSTPFWLAAGSTNTFSICYNPAVGFFGGSSADVDVDWLDSSGMSGRIYATATGYTPSCVKLLGDTVVLDDVLIGGYVEATEYAIVHKDSILRTTYLFMTDSGSVQVISPSLPTRVHAGDTIPVRFRATPAGQGRYGNGVYWGYISLSDGDNCTSTITFRGRALDSSSSGLQLFPAETELLAMTTSSQVTLDTFWFVNNYGGSVIIPSNGVKLSQGTHFSIAGTLPHALPDTITSSQNFGVIVQFSGDTSGFYHDSLTIEASHNLQGFPVYNLEALYTKSANSGVNSIMSSSPASLSLVPNPSEGPVTMMLASATKASIEIFDVLGNRVAVMPNALTSSWDPTGLSDGIYIVRANGVDENGTAFTLLKRLILAR